MQDGQQQFVGEAPRHQGGLKLLAPLSQQMPHQLLVLPHHVVRLPLLQLLHPHQSGTPVVEHP